MLISGRAHAPPDNDVTYVAGSVDSFLEYHSKLKVSAAKVLAATTLRRCVGIGDLAASSGLRKLAKERFLVAAGLLAAGGTGAVLALGRAGAPALLMSYTTCWVHPGSWKMPCTLGAASWIVCK